VPCLKNPNNLSIVTHSSQLYHYSCHSLRKEYAYAIEVIVMTTAKHAACQPLILDDVVLNPDLAGRIPHELACHYHSLPVAEANGQITVVMADPDNEKARQAIMAALGVIPRVVRGDQETIDTLLAEFWSEKDRQDLHFLVCTQEGQPENVCMYSRKLGTLLKANVVQRKLAGDWSTCSNQLNEAVGQDYDLVILGTQNKSFSERFLRQMTRGKILTRSSTSFLIACKPRWPIKKMLLVVKGEQGDSPAVDWVTRIAQLCSATITILTIVPPVPAMYFGLRRLEVGLTEILATNSALGRQLRWIAHRLVASGCEGNLRLRQGSPELEIRREVAEGDYDLTVVSAETSGWFSRFLFGDLIGPILQTTDRPVLFAKSIS
jgi:nucleotide-binding universal stress UspA family protein